MFLIRRGGLNGGDLPGHPPFWWQFLQEIKKNVLWLEWFGLKIKTFFCPISVPLIGKHIQHLILCEVSDAYCTKVSNCGENQAPLRLIWGCTFASQLNSIVPGFLLTRCFKLWVTPLFTKITRCQSNPRKNVKHHSQMNEALPWMLY